MSKKAPWVLALLAGVGWSLMSTMLAQSVREGRTTVAVDRNYSPSGPLLRVDGPIQGQTVAGVVTVSGWALSFNSIDKIELFLDDDLVPVNRAVLNMPRPDIDGNFPRFARSPNGSPGWITSFLARNYVDGPHEIRIGVTESGSPDPVFFGPITVIIDNSINQPPFGNLDLPDPGSTANGSVGVLGWALDDIDIDHIDFQIDGRIFATSIGRGGAGQRVLRRHPSRHLRRLPGLPRARIPTRSIPGSRRIWTRHSSSTGCTSSPCAPRTIRAARGISARSRCRS